MATQVFLLPDLGEGLTEAVIVSWLVSVGDTIEIDQAIAEVETAKSIVELPSPYAGTVLALHGAEGEAVLTGSPVLEVSGQADAVGIGDGTDSGEDRAGQGEDRAGQVELEAHRAEERAGASEGSGSGSGNVLIGYGTGSVAAKGRRRRKAPGAPLDSLGAVSAAGVVTAFETAGAPSSSSLLEIPITESGKAAVEVLAPAAAVLCESQAASGPVAVRSPIVRRLARELGVDPRSVIATGSDGAVTRADVLNAAKTSDVAPVTDQAAGNSALPDGNEVAGLHGLRLASSERLSPLRKAVSAKMTRSRSEIPEATVWVDVDFTDLWALRPKMADEGDRPPSITTLIARFVLLALQDYPLLASRLSEDGTELMQFDGVNLGIAVDAQRGLTVPVLPRASELSIAALDVALRELSAEAQTGRLAPARLTGSTFTFNNYGSFGVDGSAAIINHPEVAILGIGRIIERPWVVDGQIVARRIAQLSLAFDHRICDGGYAAGFLGDLVSRIEHPLRMYPQI